MDVRDKVEMAEGLRAGWICGRIAEMAEGLTVFYLHRSGRRTQSELTRFEYALADAFADFCRETFNTSAQLDYPPLRLVCATSASGLAAALFADESLTDDGRQACLFLIDDDLLDTYIEDMPLRTWLRAYFPALPRVLVTHKGNAEIALPQRRWTKKSADVFLHPERHHERLVHLFKSFWLPRFWSALRQYVRNRSGANWHTPGHSGGRAFSHSPFLKGFYEAFGGEIFRSDLSVSVEKLGDLSAPEARTPLSEAQRLTSEIFGTAQSCYVTNGTSTSNKAMLQTLLRPGETVLVDRNCHKSVHHAIAMSGAMPVYLPARYNASLGVWGPVRLGDIRAALADKPKLLILTTCTYEGVLYPVWEIARMCESAGTLFYADEAWAAHLAFHPFYTRVTAEGDVVRYNAVNAYRGAHFSVQSTHKTLAAFSQASMIHVSNRFKVLLEEDSNPAYRWLRRRFALHGRGSYEKFSHDFHEILRYWHSTSPHYPFMATLDMAGVEMRLEGLKRIDERLRWTAAFLRRVAEMCGKPEEECFASLETVCGAREQDKSGQGTDWSAEGYLKDPLKIVLMLKSPAACAQFKEALLKAHIQWEKATSATILFLVTAGTVEEHFEYLFRVCRQFKSLIGRPRAAAKAEQEMFAAAAEGQVAACPHLAALCDGELVPLAEAVGRIAGQFVVPYPPGIPVFLPGLRVTKAMVKLVENVIAECGTDAVHGLFVRSAHSTPYVEVLNRDEEERLLE